MPVGILPGGGGGRPDPDSGSPDTAVTDQTEMRKTPSLASTIGGGAWTVAERVISQGSQLILFVAAARVLSPSDFGVFALVSTSAILLLRFAEVGWAPYIMSWQGDDRVPRQVLMVALAAGLAAGTVGLIAGLAAPRLGLSSEVGHLLLLFAAWVVMATTSSAQKGMLIWLDGLRASAFTESLGEVLGMVVALAALYAGYGIYALVFGRLTYQASHLAVSFLFTRRTPCFGMEGAELVRLWRYSLQILSSRFISNLRLYAATFVIGGFLGAAPVGYYRAAQRLVGSIGEIIGAPALTLAWAMFRQARDAHGTRSDGFQKQANLYFKLLFAVGLPVFIWLALMGEDLISGLLGAKWLPALPLVAILALARALQLPGPAIEPVLSLNGEIRRLPMFSLIFLGLTLAATAIGALIGLEAVAWAQVAVGAAALVVTGLMLSRHGGIDGRQVAAELRRLAMPILFGTLTIVALRETPALADLPALVRAIGVTLPATAVYLLALTASDPWLKGAAQAGLRRLRRA